MTRTIVQFNDYVSLVVMLLMLVALVGGRSGAAELTARVAPTAAGASVVTAPFRLEMDGYIGDQAVRFGLTVVDELRQFRGEDE